MHSFITHRFSTGSAAFDRRQSISVDLTPTANVRYVGQSLKDLDVDCEFGQSVGSAVNSLTNLRRVYNVDCEQDRGQRLGGRREVVVHEDTRNYPSPPGCEIGSLSRGFGTTSEVVTRRSSLTRSQESVGSERLRPERVSSVDSGGRGKSQHKVSIVWRTVFNRLCKFTFDILFMRLAWLFTHYFVYFVVCIKLFLAIVFFITFFFCCLF